MRSFCGPWSVKRAPIWPARARHPDPKPLSRVARRRAAAVAGRALRRPPHQVVEVADADGAYDPAGLWPANEWDGWKTPEPLTAVYGGAAGMVWALDALQRRGHAESRLDLPAAAAADMVVDIENVDALQKSTMLRVQGTETGQFTGV